MSLTKTPAFIEQHFHGAYDVDFIDCTIDEILYLSEKLISNGITAFLPTLATAPLDILKKQISVIKNAMEYQHGTQGELRGARILGVNLEGCFLNPLKGGIQNENQLLLPTVQNFKLLEDDVIKLVTLAPELDKNLELTNYLKSKGIKVFAGHTIAEDLSGMDGVTHLFNAMKAFAHREKSPALEALLDDNLFCEIILDGYHVHYDVAKLVFKTKPLNKIILISDALPLAKGVRGEMIFCSKKIYLKDNKACDEKGTLAGSAFLLDDIVKKIVKTGLLSLSDACFAASTPKLLFGLDFNDYIYWDEDLNIKKVTIDNKIVFKA